MTNQVLRFLNRIHRSNKCTEDGFFRKEKRGVQLYSCTRVPSNQVPIIEELGTVLLILSIMYF